MFRNQSGELLILGSTNAFVNVAFSPTIQKINCSYFVYPIGSMGRLYPTRIPLIFNDGSESRDSEIR